MEFWGIELKPGEPHCFRLHNDEHRKLFVTKATLGEGLGKEESVTLQYSIGGDKKSSPVNTCALLANENESCSLSLVFERDDGSVEFSVEFLVIGDRGIHLTGYLVQEEGNVNPRVIEEKDVIKEKDVIEEKEHKSYRRFLDDSIFRSKNLTDRRIAGKLRNPPYGMGLYDDLLPSIEERCRMWRTLSRKELHEAMGIYRQRWTKMNNSGHR